MGKKHDSLLEDFQAVVDEEFPNLRLIREIVKLEKDSIHRSELSVQARRGKIRELVDQAFSQRAREESQ